MSNIRLNVRRDPDGKVALYKNKKEVTSVEIKKDVSMEIEVGSGFSAAAAVSSFFGFFAFLQIGTMLLDRLI